METYLDRAPQPRLRSYWSLLTVLVMAVFLFSLLVSGLRIREAIAVREPGAAGGQALAIAVALCIEGAASLAAYRVFQLRRQECAIPRYLIWGLASFVVISAGASLDHSIRCTKAVLPGTGWPALAWDVLLNVLLALAYPLGLLLAAEVLPEHIQAIDRENGARQQLHEEGRQKAAQQERKIALWALQKTAFKPPLERPATTAEDEGPGPEALQLPGESAGGWEQVRELARGAPFGIELVRRVLDRERKAADELVQAALEAGLIQRAGHGKYCFAVQSRGALRTQVGSAQQRSEEVG